VLDGGGEPRGPHGAHVVAGQAELLMEDGTGSGQTVWCVSLREIRTELAKTEL
jgi:hypothetical protein